MEIIKVRNADYARYEELLLERDSLHKEAYIAHGMYVKEFGDLIKPLTKEIYLFDSFVTGQHTWLTHPPSM